MNTSVTSLVDKSSSTHNRTTDGIGEMLLLLMEKNTFCTWDEMQWNHVVFWILFFNTIEEHPANQLRYEVYNEYMKYESVLNALNISIRVGFCPSTVSLGFQRCISPRFVQIPIKNCSQIVIFSYIFETKKQRGERGAVTFFFGFPLPPRFLQEIYGIPWTPKMDES